MSVSGGRLGRTGFSLLEKTTIRKRTRRSLLWTRGMHGIINWSACCFYTRLISRRRNERWMERLIERKRERHSIYNTLQQKCTTLVQLDVLDFIPTQATDKRVHTQRNIYSASASFVIYPRSWPAERKLSYWERRTLYQRHYGHGY